MKVPTTALLDDGPAAGDSFYTSKWDMGQLALLDLCGNRKSVRLGVCVCHIAPKLLIERVYGDAFDYTTR